MGANAGVRGGERPLARAAGGPEPRATFGDVFAVAEFRALWAAQILSFAGDQLARVALTLLVFRQTHSALLSAITFAASSVPMFVGGLTLSPLADRLPRRQVMIACDLSRAALVTIMAVPGLPLWARVGPLFMVTLISAPFSSARAAVYPDILSGDRYVLGTAVTITTLQFSQVAGFAAGGVLAGLFGTGPSLLTDAATFLASALITRRWVHARPAAGRGAPAGTCPRPGAIAGLRLVFGDPRLRMPMLLGWLAAFYNIPSGVAAPLGQALGGGDSVAGLILAAGALGASLGAVLFSRFVDPERRVRWMSPAAAASCAVLLLFWFRPGLPATLVILVACGLFNCYQIAASAAFVSAAPARHRSHAFGIAQGGLSLGQGAAMVLAGFLAQHYPADGVIACGGLLGLVATLLITVGGNRAGGAKNSPR
jgi:MFS family permease